MFAHTQTAFMAVLLIAIANLLDQFAEAPVLTYFQNSVPEASYGRLISLVLLSAQIGAVVGSLPVAWLVTTFGNQAVTTTLAITIGVLGPVYLAYVTRTRTNQPIAVPVGD